MRRQAIPVLVAAACVLAGWAVSTLLRNAELERVASDYARRRENLTALLEFPEITRFSATLLQALDDLREVALDAVPLERARFDAVLRPLSSLPGVSVHGSWVRRVESSDRVAYEAESGRSLVDLDGDAIRPDARPVYYPIAYTDSSAPAAPRVGCDLGSDPWLRTAIETAERTGLPVAASRLDLRGPTDEVWMEWFRFLPVRGPGPQGRILGVVVIATSSSVQELNRMFSLSLGGLDAMALPSATGSEDEPPTLELPSLEEQGWPAAAARWWKQSAIEHVSPIGAPSFNWWLVTQPRRELLATSQTLLPRAVEACALLSAFLLWLYMTSLIDRGEKVRVLVERRTKELARAKAELEESLAERRSDLARLQESEARFRALFHQAPDACFLLDLDGHFLDGNEAAFELVDRRPEDLAGKALQETMVLVGEQLEAAQRILERIAAGERTGPDELVLTARDGRAVQVEVHAQPVQVHGRTLALGIARDISERIRLAKEREAMERQLRSTQKLEALATLAGGIAHDFNNLLTAILGHLDVLQARAASDPEIAEVVEVIESATNRAGKLTQNLLGFAREGKQRDATFDLHGSIREVTRLLAPAIDDKIRVRLDLAAEAPFVKGDTGQIEQVLLNLALNARDAMPDGGDLEVGTGLVRLEPSSSSGTEVHRGPYVVMTVSDSGTGIAAEHLDRIFEPFFTTKSPDEGSGMGLATAYGIVKNHGGTIEVESRPGQGTTFRVYLPQRRGETPTSTRNEDDAPARAKGGATILIIDDEEPILRGVSRVLRGLGYTVETAKSPLRAIAWFEEHAAEVDLVILDLVMPRLGGKACFERLRSIRPDLRILLSTGHGRDGAAQEILDAGAVGFLPKPYDRRQLADAVAKALASDQA